MCEPVTIAATAALVAGGVSAYGQYQSGQYQKAVGETNAKMAEQQARDAAEIGGIEEERYRAQLRAIQAKQRAAFAGNGVDFTTGTPLGVLAETARTGETDAQNIRANALRQAWGYKVEALNRRAEGRLASMRGKYGAASTLLTSGAQAYGTYKGL